MLITYPQIIFTCIAEIVASEDDGKDVSAWMVRQTQKVSKHKSKTGHFKQSSVPLSPVLMLQLTSNPAHSYLCVLLSNPFCLELRLPVPGGIKSAEVTILIVLFDIVPVSRTRIFENFWLLLFTLMIPSQNSGQPPVLDLDA